MDIVQRDSRLLLNAWVGAWHRPSLIHRASLSPSCAHQLLPYPSLSGSLDEGALPDGRTRSFHAGQLEHGPPGCGLPWFIARLRFITPRRNHSDRLLAEGVWWARRGGGGRERLRKGKGSERVWLSSLMLFLPAPLHTKQQSLGAACWTCLAETVPCEADAPLRSYPLCSFPERDEIISPLADFHPALSA